MNEQTLFITFLTLLHFFLFGGLNLFKLKTYRSKHRTKVLKATQKRQNSLIDHLKQ